MRYYIWFAVAIFAACFLFVDDGDAGFFRRGRGLFRRPCPNVTGPCAGCKEEEPPVQRPLSPVLSPASTPESTSQPRQDTVLVPREGTGSRSLIGGGKPLEITHQIPPGLQSLLESFRQTLASGSSGGLKLPITLPLEPETSAALSATAKRLDWLSWLLLPILLLFGGEKAGQLGAQAVAGLRSVIGARSEERAAQLAALEGLLRAVNRLQEANQGAGSSTSKPAT